MAEKTTGTTIDHKGEQQIVELIKKLSSDGMSMRQIADILTKTNVPTKKGARKWHPEMIRRVLNIS